MTSRLCLIVAVVTTAAGCAPSSPTESRESNETDRGSLEVDTVFVVTRPDLRKCAYPMCGGVYVKAVNKAKTTCLDGSKHAECYVSSLDLAALGLSDANQEEVLAGIREGRVVVSGQLAELDEPEGVPPGFAVLRAHEAYRAATDHGASGTYWRVEPSGITCIKAPCPTLTAHKLNATTEKPVTDVDYSALGLSDEEIAGFGNQMASTGLVVSGSVHSVTSSGETHKWLNLTEVFEQVLAEGPKLCLDDAACGEEAHCDTTECLSNCKPGMICPAVCYGQCVAGAPASGGSCVDACGDIAADGSCYCDDVCVEYGDCCADRDAVCL